MLTLTPIGVDRVSGRATSPGRYGEEHEPVLERRCICVFAFGFALLLALAAFAFGGCAIAMLTVAARMKPSRELGGMVDICISISGGQGTCVEEQAGGGGVPCWRRSEEPGSRSKPMLPGSVQRNVPEESS